MRHNDPFFEMQDLFRDVRVPKVIALGEGIVLAFADRAALLRRSTDGGRSWGQTLETGSETAGGICLDENSGDVLIVCPQAGYLLRSRNAGQGWERETIRIVPNASGHGTPEGVPANATASESGLTLRHGEHAGRLLMPVRIQPPAGNNEQEFWAYNYNAALYSDEGGATWQVSDPVQSGTGEGTLAELSDGRIYYNSRCHMAVDHRRRIAWSHDGGHRWTDWQVSDELYEIGEPFYFKYGTKPSYGCNAGLVRVPPAATDGEEVLLFSTPDNPGRGRVRMTVWASFDGAQRWPVKRLVHSGPSAYSSITADPEGNVYLLFERGEEELYDTMALARFNLAWLTEHEEAI